MGDAETEPQEFIDWSILAVDKICQCMGWNYRVLERVGTAAKIEAAKTVKEGHSPVVDIYINAITRSVRGEARIGNFFPLERARIKADCRIFLESVKYELNNGEQLDTQLNDLIALIQSQGLGRAPESDLEKAATWLAWHMIPKNIRRNQQAWLDDKLGTTTVKGETFSNVSQQTFYKYKRFVPKERLTVMEETIQ